MSARHIALALLLVTSTAHAREPERRTFYDERGRITGRSVTRDDGRRVDLYDERGRSAGRKERTSDGWKQYDARGRSVGRVRER